jgi:hypothetical protein
MGKRRKSEEEKNGWKGLQLLSLSLASENEETRCERNIQRSREVCEGEPV